VCVSVSMCRAVEPLVAALRSALGANGVIAARLGACGSLSRSALGAEGVGAARPRQAGGRAASQASKQGCATDYSSERARVTSAVV